MQLSSYAQLKADFTADKTGGCSPVAIAFVSTTTGASSEAVYEWNFDNGNTSSLINASAIFEEERAYTVTLTVKDSGKTSAHTLNITVYKKPMVDFTVSVARGCAPLPVTFTSSSSAGDGSIAKYFWDFGDGTTGETNTAGISHTYLSGQKPSVILAVTDNHGCSNNSTISNLLDVLPGVTASFDADKTFLCFETDPIRMINHSSGSAPLLYNWNFGDSSSSTETDPVHVFNKKGAFTVQLIVQNSYGCRDTLTKSSYLNVANFKSEITVQDIICNGSEIDFKNSSSPVPSSFLWTVDGIDTVDADWYGLFKYKFTNPGNHTIQLTNTFGSCIETISKTVNVKKLLEPKGFIANVPTHCFPPVTIAFHDTTTGAEKTEWNFERYTYPISPQVTGKDASYTFTQANNWLVTLFVTDVNGCVDTVEQYVRITQPEVRVVALDNNGWEDCISLTKKFSFITDEVITSVTWDFGNGATSSDLEPTYTFTGEGGHRAFLTYTTASGCTGTAYSDRIDVYRKPVANFVSISGTTICGNSTMWFERDYDYYMYFDTYIINGEYAGNSYYNRMNYQFKDTGLYTVTLIAYNFANTVGCRDTMTRVDYIRVLPSFPKISEAKNTCDGDRGTVTFTQTSRYAEKWIWDFGDSTTLELNSEQPVVTHRYTRSGNYKVVLTTINGQCAVGDSVYVYVLLKQNPLLSSTKTTICKDEGLNYTLTNLTPQPYTGFWVWDYLDNYEYNDGTRFQISSNSWDESWIYTNPYNNSFKDLVKGKDSIRVIIREAYFNCLDTSNFIPLKVLGSQAGFDVITDTVCYGSPVIFNDTSNAYNTNIINREWNFGDGLLQIATGGGRLSHYYASPGAYVVTLKVSDDGGCTSTTSFTAQQVIVNGPMAAFTASATNIQLNTTVEFINNTNNFNSSNTQYDWRFGDGAFSNEYAPSHIYVAAGIYQVMLIAQSNETGCTDTAFQTITVNNFAAGFSFLKSFIQNNNCPPLLYQFTNTSINYIYTRWDFGDGNVVENSDHPNHLYTSPGVYIIRLFVKGYNGLEGTYTDTIIIDKKALSLNANPLHSCTAQTITLNAVTTKAAAFTWDFGDGTIVHSTDTFAVHDYLKAGIYNPKIIVEDSSGCSSSVSLVDKIVIDSLYVSLQNITQKICAPKGILLNPVIVNIAADQAQQTLTYHWNFGTGNTADTSDVKEPTFIYQRPGSYPVSLKVQSPYGCVKEVGTVITALQGLGGQVNGPAAICRGATAQFTGTTQLAGQPHWKWIFDDGTVVEQQNPPARLYNDTGIHLIKLIVDNQGCADTVTSYLTVNQKPVVGLSLKQTVLCEGSRVVITASGGNLYQWTPSNGLDNINAASITASPVINTSYSVAVTDNNGCTSKDSVAVTVIHPFALALSPDAVVCSGKSVTLNASGANTYKWIQVTTGLDNTAVANPTASPASTTIFTVTGTDAANCFSDTASIKVTVLPSPAVDAGQPVVVLAGNPTQLQAITSNDVVQWDWTPAKYLSCINCADPITTPAESLRYTVTVINSQGCSASDTVSVGLLCSESRIFIPAAFSPNNDGVNDKFYIKGQGIRIVNNFSIYDRYGEIIFERSNFQPGDINASWDGRYKGKQVPVGSYVYIAKMSCNEKTFMRKGTVTVVY